MEDLCLDILRKDIVKRISLSDYLNLILSCKKLYVQNISTISGQLCQRLSNLLSNKTNAPGNTFLNIIKSLSRIGVIAGGSVVYALNDFVPPDTVSDIDVFLPTKETFREAFNLLKESGMITSVYLRCPKTYNEWEYFRKNTVTVIDVQLMNFDTKYDVHLDGYRAFTFNYQPCTYSTPTFIQLIYQEFSHPTDVIASFDLDYVQCCFSKGFIYRSRACVESHTQRRIKTGYYIPRAARMEKGLLKGFDTTIIGKRTSYIGNALRIQDLTEFKLKPLGNRKTTSPIDLTCVEILRLVRSEHKQYFKNNIKVTTLAAVYQIGDLEFEGDFLSFEIDILSVDLKTLTATIKPIRLDENFEINKVLFTKEYPFIPTGKRFVEVGFNLVEARSPKRQILMLVEEFLGPNAGVLQIPGGFRIEV